MRSLSKLLSRFKIKPQSEDTQISLLCSNCFKDQGLRLDAENVGIYEQSICKNCGSSNGRKLTKHLLHNVAYRFFVLGTMIRTLYGGAPHLQLNYQNESKITPGPWFAEDLDLLKKTIDARIFFYGPRLWMIGHITPLQQMQEASTRLGVLKRVVKEYPPMMLMPEHLFYRVRKEPASPADTFEYDSPPSHLSGQGRIDSPSLGIMYASQDLQLCLHECRVVAEDKLFAATMCSTRPLKLLNLAHLFVEEDVTEFESLDLAVSMLFLAGRHSYEIIRELASLAFLEGYDGLNYPSYFSLLRTGAIPFETQFGLSNRWAAGKLQKNSLANYEIDKVVPNLALFGHPLAEGKVSVRCINQVALRQVSYDIIFGPVGYS